MKQFMKKMTGLFLACALLLGGAVLGTNIMAKAEMTAVEPAADPSPAIYVAQKNAASVVGVITSTQSWNRSTGEVELTPVSQGSGVVIREGGYVLTNYHVVQKGDGYQVLLPDGEKADATVVGTDSSLDLAVLKVIDADDAAELVPVTVGSSSDLIVGSTVVAIGNPGGEVLANTVTQGIVSALERSSVNSSNTTRNVDYIQHDAAINNGNSGGGLFNYKGELVGINTLKYAGSAYSSVTFEGLGFAIPVDTAYPIAQQLIDYGKVRRPQMGVTVDDNEGPDEPMNNYAPASAVVMSVNEGSAAEKAGMKQYDFIYAVNGNRVKSFRELSAILDKMEAGETVTVTVVRYAYADYQTVQSYNPYGSFGFGFGFNFGNSSSSSQSKELVVGGGYEFIDLDVTLELPEED